MRSQTLSLQLILSSLLACILSSSAGAVEQDAIVPENGADAVAASIATTDPEADQVPESEPLNQTVAEDEQQATFAEAIAAGTVLNQMSMEQVLQARGEPDQKEVIPPDAELWRYAEGEVAFSAGKVTYVSLKPNKRAPAPSPPQREMPPPYKAPESRPAPSEPSTQVAAPSITVGDTYVYESKALDGNSGPGSSLVTRRTVTGSGGVVTLSSLLLRSQGAEPRTLYYDREWNLTKSRNASGSGRDYSPALRYYDFPLYPGKTWRQTTTETDITTGAIRQHTLSGRVEGWETVSVPAGTFHGIKVVLQTELFDPSTGEHITGSDTSWYVPEVRRSVKSLMAGKGGNQRLIQLLSYALNGHTPVGAEEADTPSTDELVVDGKVIAFEAIDVDGHDAAAFQMVSNGYRNTYLIDCANERFLWINNVDLRTGQETGNNKSAEWREMSQSSRVANAVHRAACPE